MKSEANSEARSRREEAEARVEVKGQRMRGAAEGANSSRGDGASSIRGRAVTEMERVAAEMEQARREMKQAATMGMDKRSSR